MKEQMVSRNQEKYHIGNILKTNLTHSYVNEINRTVLESLHKTVCELGRGEGFISINFWNENSLNKRLKEYFKVYHYKIIFPVIDRGL